MKLFSRVALLLALVQSLLCPASGLARETPLRVDTYSRVPVWRLLRGDRRPMAVRPVQLTTVSDEHGSNWRPGLEVRPGMQLAEVQPQIVVPATENRSVEPAILPAVDPPEQRVAPTLHGVPLYRGAPQPPSLPSSGLYPVKLTESAVDTDRVAAGSPLPSSGLYPVKLTESAVDTDRVDNDTAGARTASAEAPPPACSPMCTWQCESLKCEQVCEPECQAPRCETRCQSADTSGCQFKCDEPQCSVMCPQRLCPLRECGECKTMCSEPMCMLSCPTSQPCRNVCESPKCDWRCKAPEECPKPVCRMICESPRDCSTETTFHHQLPEKAPGETAIRSFRAPLSEGPGGGCKGNATGNLSAVSPRKQNVTQSITQAATTPAPTTTSTAAPTTTIDTGPYEVTATACYRRMNGLGEHTGLKMEHCKAKCTAETECVGFSYSSEAGDCALAAVADHPVLEIPCESSSTWTAYSKIQDEEPGADVPTATEMEQMGDAPPAGASPLPPYAMR
jgi:hypothetical protein